MTAYRKKLIEVALPLDAINREAAREKSIRHGHPSTLHLWWARRPLAACRAVLFAQLVDDPETDEERQRLFGIIEELVKWENSNNEEVLERARAEIRKSCGGSPPPVLDPFCGGGSIPLEAQRLGLEAHGSDLNPVAVLITKALIEIPPQWAGCPPVHPDAENRTRWEGAQGLAEDVRLYGRWMRDQAERRIGHLYPKATLPDGRQATVIAWLWARTVTCPNPACQATMPLVRSFWLGKKKGKEAWVRPVPERDRVRFEIGHGPQGPPVAGTVSRTGATCLVCSSHVPLAHVRAEGKAGRMGAQLMAVVAEGVRQRIYLPPTEDHEEAADIPRPADVPDTEVPYNPRYLTTPNYGMTHHADLFTNRQLVALTTLSDLVGEARKQVGGNAAYADAVVTYMAFAVDRMADRHSSQASWDPNPSGFAPKIRSTFARQALPMTWDFAEGNPFSDSSGNLHDALVWVTKVLDRLVSGAAGLVQQADATALINGTNVLVATDPPYYDNVGYADLADFFYVWLRRSLRDIYPDLLGTVLTPKTQELVADPIRSGGDLRVAKRRFEEGFERAFTHIRQTVAPDVPMTVFYAFKQAEKSLDGTASTGWETMLEGLLRAGFAVTGTWPMRTELGNRMRNQASNALASSIVLACRPRPADAGITDRRGFLAALKRELPDALRKLQLGNIAPVDLAQAAIGPGMAVFSRYAKVVEPDGTGMRVRTALGLINQVLGDVLAEQEDEFDADTRWAIRWFEQRGFDEGPYGDAEVLATAMVTSVGGLQQAGILSSRGGKVRLLGRDELAAAWDPATDSRTPVWEVTQHLIKRLDDGGEQAAADLLRHVRAVGEVARDLAYRLYSICERKKWAKDALGFNALVTSWPEIARLASSQQQPATEQETMFP
ncbi:MAG: DUF1156 domain-containing protein [Egibacteraceae bacterium]